METEELLQLMRNGVKALTTGQSEVAVAYSGGLDSSVVAALAAESARVKAYTCAVAGSRDHVNAEVCAKQQGIPHQLIQLEDHRLINLVREVSRVLRSGDPTKVAYTIPVFAVIQESKEHAVLTGSGADELFGGYAKYASVSSPETQMNDDLQKVIAENATLSEYASKAGRFLGSPFLAGEVIRFSKELGLEAKILAGERKVILRDAARMLGISSYNAPKKAAQYSSGTLRRIRTLASAEGLNLRDWMANIHSD